MKLQLLSDRYHTHGISLLVLLLLLCNPYTAKTQEHSLWQDLGLYGGQINTVVLDPDQPHILYAGAWGGDGLFRSSDSGINWQAIPAKAPAWFKNLEVYQIAVDPHDPATVWVANNHFLDVSSDAGETWKTFFFGDDERRFCYTVAIDPHDPSGNTVYAGTGGPDNADEYGEIFFTIDGGATWDKMYFDTAQFNWNNFWQITFNPLTAGEVWAANRKSHLSPDGQIFLRPARDDTWYYWSAAIDDGQAYYFGYLDEILLNPADPRLVLAASEYGIARKTDGPALSSWHWTEIAETCRALCASPAEPDTVYAGLLDRIAISEDQGGTWGASRAAPAEFISMQADPYRPGLLYAGSINSGLFRTDNRGSTWQQINNGLLANAIFSTDILPSDNHTLLAGTLSGIFVHDVGSSWRQISSRIAHTVRYHPSASGTLYAGHDWELSKSTDGGSTWSFLDISDSESSHSVASIAVLPQGLTASLVFAAIRYGSGDKGELMRINDQGSNFAEAPYDAILTTTAPVNALAISPQSPAVIYAGTGSFFAPVVSGGLYQSLDAGKTWQPAPLPPLVVNSIAVAPGSPHIVYAGCGASDGSYAGIYKTADAGKTWEPFISGLPAVFAVSDIAVDSSSSQIVYAALYKGFADDYANLAGIYVTLNGGAYWTQIGLADYRLYDLAITSEPAAPQARLAACSAPHAALPADIVIAGTASGAFKATTAGTGIVSGTVKDADSGAPIDAAVVATTYGSHCISAEGYYMLLLPAGLHRLQTQASGYVQASAPSVTVSPGQSLTMDILMQPSTTDNGSTCLAERALSTPARRSRLGVVRTFRDHVLQQTPAGRRLVDLYYAIGNDVWPVLRARPALLSRCCTLFDDALPIIAAAAQGKQPPLPASLLNSISSFLFELESSSPPALRSKLLHVRSHLRSTDYQKLFAIRQDLR